MGNKSTQNQAALPRKKQRLDNLLELLLSSPTTVKPVKPPFSDSDGASQIDQGEELIDQIYVALKEITPKDDCYQQYQPLRILIEEYIIPYIKIVESWRAADLKLAVVQERDSNQFFGTVGLSVGFMVGFVGMCLLCIAFPEIPALLFFFGIISSRYSLLMPQKA